MRRGGREGDGDGEGGIERVTGFNQNKDRSVRISESYRKQATDGY